jgi:2'-5' RNA ligase superfamily
MPSSIQAAADRVWAKAKSIGRRALSWRRGSARRDPAIVVLVPEVAGIFTALGVDPPGGLPPHITLLFPFRPAGGVTPAVEERLARICADLAPVRFELASTGRFPTVLYATPEPAGPFKRMTEAFVDAWPESPPYDGAFEEVVPHLTVADGAPTAALTRRLAAALPVSALARDVCLARPVGRSGWDLSLRVRLAAEP